MKKLFTLLFIFSVLFPPAVLAESARPVVRGHIRSTDGSAAEYAVVYIEGTTISTMTDEAGRYSLTVPAGSHTLSVKKLGYKQYKKKMQFASDQNVDLDITVEPDGLTVDEIVVTEKSAAARINESAYSVKAISTVALHNSTLDISSVLDRVSGVRVRESGGVGSDASFTLNGFSGRHVKFFMDGVPMEGFGSSFQINNIPVNIAERIEIYKGVVPVSFGADALGGVVNIVTKKEQNTFIDASYSFGSFNTHRSYLNIGHTARNGFTLNVNAYQNYSDNDYNVHVNLVDQDGKFDEHTTKVKRFNDKYRNETVILQTGVVGKRWAEKLLFGITLGQNKKHIQNANNMNFVYGEKYNKGNTIMPTLSYRVENAFVKGLDLSVNANYNLGYSMNVDTASYRKYDWEGNYTQSNTRGEASYQLYKYRDNNGSVVFNAAYSPGESHSFYFNDVVSTFRRKGEDKLASSNEGSYPSVNTQNVAGLGYTYSYRGKWNTDLFGKHYYKYSESHVAGSDAVYEKVSGAYNTFGYGLATTYHVNPMVQLKASYEKAYRLPTGRELFGNNDLEVGNSDLKAENSNNVNFGATFNRRFGKQHDLYMDAGLVYRDIKDFIRRKVSESKGTAQSDNEGRVRNMGINAEARYTFRGMVSVGGSFTYQDIRNVEKSDLTYKDRIPNTPYLYSNADISLFLRDLGTNGNNLSFTYNNLYVHEFFLRWPSYGSSDSKYIVPSQFSHDVSLTYSLQYGTYNITFECRNLTDECLYDNYSLEKPGRSFSVKFRYHIRFSKKKRPQL